jgi:signal transduction histidine kinase
MATRVAPAVLAERRSTVHSLRVPATLVAGGLATAFSTWFAWDSPLVPHPEAVALAKGSLIAFYVAVGSYTWWQRPASRLGPLIAGAGLLYTVTALAASTDSLAFTVGRVALAALVAYFAALFVCFPRERLVSELERRFVVGVVASTVVVWTVVLALARTLPHGGPLTDCTKHCPENALRLVDTSHAVTSGVNAAATVYSALVIAMVVGLLAWKARHPAPLRRRAIAPLLFATILFGGTYAAYTVVTEASGQATETTFRALMATGTFAIPLALLLGQYRGRIFAATSLFRALRRTRSQRVTPLWVQDFLGGTLGDPSFALGVWDSDRDRYLDAEGEPLELPRPSPARSVTEIEKNGRPSLALIHDSALDDEPELVEGLGATAVMLLENAGLVEELKASRARIVESAEQERLRLERDLHDGAQQRLMAIQVKLALARERTGSAELAAQLDELAADASAAVEELRTLAHGIYPTVLYERGLGAALQAFATVAPIEVHVIDRGVGRAPPATEAAVYYCLLEALQNAVKHAGPEAKLVVTLTRSGDLIAFEVRDDGLGFDLTADRNGVGLVNMRDRIGAVGGMLWLASSQGTGTTVSGTVPVDA